MAAQNIISVAESNFPSFDKKNRTSASASSISPTSTSTTSSSNNNKKMKNKKKLSSMLNCFPTRRQRKSPSSSTDMERVVIRPPVEGSSLSTPIPFSERRTRPSDLDCSLFSHYTKSVPVCEDIFATHTTSGLHYISPNAFSLCAHETISVKVTAPHSPGTLAAPTPIAELALDMHSGNVATPSVAEDGTCSLTYTPTQAPPPMSPLPSYMDPIEDLEIRDNLTAQSHEDVSTFSALLNDKTGWKEMGMKHGVKVARKEVGLGKPALVKGTLRFNMEGASADDVIDFFWETNPMLYNDTVEASFRLRTWSENLCVFYQSYKGAMGAQGRDFVMYGTRSSNEDKKQSMFVSRSCEWAKTSDMLAPRVRAQCYIGGMICSVVDPGILELTQIWQADLSGSLPDMVKRIVSTASVGSLASATKLFAKTFTQ